VGDRDRAPPRSPWTGSRRRRPSARLASSTAPKAKRSLGSPASRPSNCSGAMYCSVPRTVPSAVAMARDDSRSPAIPLRPLGAFLPSLDFSVFKTARR
jgi:hypothetical protein